MSRLLVEVQPLCETYTLALAQQHLSAARLLDERKGGSRGRAGYIHIGEHAPVFTLGKHAKQANVLRDAGQLLAPVVRIDRGGDVTYHGPGQLVMYPIFDLHCMGIGARLFVERLLQAVSGVLSGYRIDAMMLPDAAGLWLPAAQTRPLRKICAIGVHISRGISTHGIALNVNTDLAPFGMINPCGFTDRGVTSMALELGTQLPMAEVQRALLCAVGEIFGIELRESNGRESK